MVGRAERGGGNRYALPVTRPAIALLLLAPSLGCPRPAWPADTVVLLVESPPETLDRRLALSAVAENVAGLLEPGLLRIADDGRPVPDLAESYEQTDPITYLFTLRRGLRFSDGSPLVAADVAATFESLLSPRLASPLAAKFSALSKVEALDDLHVRVRLRAPLAPFLAEMTMGIVPARRQAAPGETGFGRRPAGAGPFRFVSWPDEEHLLLQANPNYYAGAPPIRHLLVETVRDETTRALALESGHADIAVNAISPPLLARLASVPGIAVLRRPGAGTAYLMFRMDDPRLSHRKVREAIACAIDRQALVRYKLLGYGEVADSLLPPQSWAHGPPRPRPGRDLARAQALLDEAGFPRGPDGFRFTLGLKTSTDRFRRSVAAAIAQELSEAGIRVRQEPLEFGTFFSDIRRGEFQIAAMKWVPILEPDLLYWVFDSASIPAAANGFTGFDREGYRDPVLDGILEAARTAPTRRERAADYARAQDILARDLPYFVLWYEDSVAVVRDDIEGFRPSPFGFFDGLATARRVVPPGRER